jgi:hypothetical protein
MFRKLLQWRNKPEPESKISLAGFQCRCTLEPVIGVLKREKKPKPFVEPYQARITFKHWERETRREYLYVLWTVPRFLLIRLWYLIALGWAKLWGNPALIWEIAFSGRRESIEPLWCERCIWSGRRKDAVHTYHSFGDDVEPADECPRCGGDI